MVHITSTYTNVLSTSSIVCTAVFTDAAAVVRAVAIRYVSALTNFHIKNIDLLEAVVEEGAFVCPLVLSTC